MDNTKNPHFVEFEKVLDKLKNEGKIVDDKPPVEPEKRKSYITRLTSLFKKEIHGRNQNGISSSDGEDPFIWPDGRDR